MLGPLWLLDRVHWVQNTKSIPTFYTTGCNVTAVISHDGTRVAQRKRSGWWQCPFTQANYNRDNYSDPLGSLSYSALPAAC